MRNYTLLGTCPDKVGIVARITGFIAEHGGSIIRANQYEDIETRMFYMRYVVDANTLNMDAESFRQAFIPIAQELDMEWRLTDSEVPQRVVLLVSKLEHCLADLLHLWRSGDLPFDLACVISNHEDMRRLVEWHGVPYHYVPVPKDEEGKRAAFDQTAQLIDQAKPDTIVLARYMQILPPWLCRAYPNRIINIHHSFLPSFIGAKPYHQAFQRGVKLTGATCHYVTEELDAGPIIEQDVVRIRHHDTVEDLVRLGKDVEKTVLARGLRYHLEDRVLVQGNKTVVFT
ncbi:formyltetrahydrofolate deformylase [Parahaliea sp. F7430]|uniref:Formyltetrahydrofolate deformylase n=1 Tax=Sediminihaliea albiluteola TaxID=2758564 RepID=A0A7W2TUU1_9GAMM|nr:formyltetrahydrofolate deformylase [Sediminihaliea albiluteola]MBA6412273.1 formyltetrahydrofolate deformylase [Sediminihaliea albiluteola]